VPILAARELEEWPGQGQVLAIRSVRSPAAVAISQELPVIGFKRRVQTVGLALGCLLVILAPAAPPPFLPGFAEAVVASGLRRPTAMGFAPDGRLFVCEQGGTLRVIKNSTLLATPFVSVTVNSSGERGLLASRSIRRLRPTVCLYLLHGDHADCSQSRQPVHRCWRRGGGRQ
jgi:hypothetical protein